MVEKERLNVLRATVTVLENAVAEEIMSIAENVTARVMKIVICAMVQVKLNVEPVTAQEKCNGKLDFYI